MPGLEPDLTLSGLQHFSFCRRQWALIFIEQLWKDNYLTVDGTILHERTDDPFFTEKRGDTIVSRALPVRSEKYGVGGVCDVVLFRADSRGVPLAGREGLWLPTPVEYKRGKPQTIDADRLQLCGQAICLEEMLCCPTIETAYIYYDELRRREEVVLGPELRAEVGSMLTEMRELRERGFTPRVKPKKQCASCSMKDICMPSLLKQGSAKEYNKQIWGT